MAVGGAFLSAFLQVLFDRLASEHVVDFINFIRKREIENGLKRLNKTLLALRTVLNDAEDKQNNNEAVKIWLDELKNVIYDAEDVLDEFATEALRWKLEGDSGTCSYQVWSLISTSLNPKTFLFNVEIESKIREIAERLDELAKERFELGLKEVTEKNSNSNRETSCLVDETCVYGRDKDKEKIVELLLRNNNKYTSDDKFSVVPIVGMGGIGKTTLAQIVYNDDRVKKHFDLMAWVCVSEFDVKGITKRILELVTSRSCDFNDLNQVQLNLKMALVGKKFLIVLDDVWNMNYGSWRDIQTPFLGAEKGSYVIVTTRRVDVASMMGSVDSHFLEHLSKEECWSVFFQHAFKHKNGDINPNFLLIGQKIVGKCKGLPLAAITLGGLLRSKNELTEWGDVLNSEIWDLNEEESGILPALKLSYRHLPSHLKRCFAFCSIFPKGYEFAEMELVLLWMAEGFITKVGDKQIEDVGCDYFRDLLLRSFFQLSTTKKSRYVMHDLINDLAQYVAGEVCFKLNTKVEGQKQRRISKNARHSSYICRELDGFKNFEAFNEVKSLRTFLPLRIRHSSRCYLSCNVHSKLLPELICLRVLSLSGYRISKLPNAIGNLKHLRYLNLSGVDIRTLPDTVSTLYNLQILLLKGCYNLEKLPDDMGNLINLRNLDITGATSIVEMPQRLGRLTNLQTLSNFVAGKRSGCQVNELMNLSHLRGVISVMGLENVADAQEACEAKLNDKPNIHSLNLEWSSCLGDNLHSNVVEDVLQMLKPHENLREFGIRHYGGTRFPGWVGDPSYKNLVFLKFNKCVNCKSLPPLGRLPSLKDLQIIGMNDLDSIDIGFYGNGCSEPFRSLETLLFKDMKEWMNWSQIGLIEQVQALPCLRELSMVKCPKLLGKLPEHLPLLQKLVIRGCENLEVSTSSFPMLCKLEIEGCKRLVNCSSSELSSLSSISVGSISELKSVDFIQGFTRLENLRIDGCEELISLWWGDPCLDKFGQDCFSMLRVIRLRNCNSFECLPHLMMCNNGSVYLEQLYISECDSLTHIARGHLPPTLRRLEIHSCKRLHCLLECKESSSSSSVVHVENSCSRNSTSLLEYLIIESCPSLRSLIYGGKLPETLKVLEIVTCPELESITDSLDNNMFLESICVRYCDNLKYIPAGLHEVRLLHQIVIGGCPSLITFPEVGLSSTNLRELSIYDCEKLKARHIQINNLINLQNLVIAKSPGILSFLEMGFPISITSLTITGPEICKVALEWGLHRLTYLKNLFIKSGCPDMESFPPQGRAMLLPASLNKLTIEDFPELKCLSSRGFHNLTSLRSLTIQNLPKLQNSSFKVLESVTCLESLTIYNCPNLTSFPEEGLPPSLLQLRIWKCPRLKERCAEDIGQDWLKIAHVPFIMTSLPRLGGSTVTQIIYTFIYRLQRQYQDAINMEPYPSYSLEELSSTSDNWM